MPSLVGEPSKRRMTVDRSRLRLPVVLDARVVAGSGGGPDKTVLNSPRFLKGSYRNLCAYMHPPGDPGFDQLRAKARRWGAPLLSVPDRGPWDWQVIPRLLNVCRRERVSVWHGHDYKSNLLGLVLRRFWPMRLVTTVHGWGVKETRRTHLYYGVDRWCLPHYECVVCVSPDLRAACLACGVPAERCVLVENGIDTDEFRRRRTAGAAKRQLGLPPDSLVLGAVGRLSAEKGFELLIRAVDQLLQVGRDVQLLIVGEGEEKPILRALIQNLDRADRIHLLGYRADVREVYEAMDAFVLSSYREGLPNVLLEAMAMTVPVVATRVAGVPRLIQDGANGLLLEPGSVEQLTHALTHLLRDADLRKRLAQAGRQTIEGHFSFQQRMDRIRDLYDALLSRQPVPVERQVSRP